MRASVATILRDLGLLLHLPVALALVTVPVALLAGETFALVPLLATAAAGAALGQAMYRPTRGAGPGPMWVSLVVVALTWLLAGLLCALPLYGVARLAGSQVGTAGVFVDPLSAAFEAMSGLTSTGLTMVDAESGLPRTVQWWRSLLEWVGGAGVVVLIVAVVRPAESSRALFRAETRDQPLTTSMRTTALRIAAIYLALTVASVAGFAAVGMPAWHALNHGMTGIATGGFTVTDDSFRLYSQPIRAVACAVMAIGAISFTVQHTLFVRRDWRRVARGTEVRLLAGLLVGGAVVVTLLNGAGGEDPAILDSVFQWTSALGTAGFASVALSGWSQAALLLLVLGMVVGGSSGSTTGGLKIARLAWILKGVAGRFRDVEEPEGDGTAYRWDDDGVDWATAKRAIANAASLGALWLLTLLAGTIGLLVATADATPLAQALFDAASALGNVGLSTVTGPDLPGAAKVVLMALMWMGRLEIVAALVLLAAPLALVDRQRAERMDECADESREAGEPAGDGEADEVFTDEMTDDTPRDAPETPRGAPRKAPRGGASREQAAGRP